MTTTCDLEALTCSLPTLVEKGFFWYFCWVIFVLAIIVAIWGIYIGIKYWRENDETNKSHNN